MKTYSFEKLDVWRKAKDFGINIYKATKFFPDEEKFGLTSQLRRASVSITSNIAEGSSRKSSKDQARFYMYAYSSTVEILNQLIFSKDLGFLGNDHYKKLREDLEEITAMLNQLYRSTQRNT